MKVNSKALKPSLILAVLACLLALQHASARASRQEQVRGISIRMVDGKDVRLYENSYALVIGVSDYTRGWPKLPGVKNDIEEVARALERQGFQVTKVENPDSSQLDKAFKTFIDEHGLSVENRLLFYFAGHGHTIKQSYGEEMGYIVPSDAPDPKSDPAGFMSKAMDMQQMELYARRIQSKHALFLFDSCFSGAIFALSRAVPDSIGYKTARPVRQFITSGSADETVPDRSVFREQFIEAIEGEADSNHDNYVTGTELGMFLQDKVTNYSKNTQHPQYGKLRNPNLDKGDFVFALLKNGAVPAVVARPDAGATTTSPSPARVDSLTVELAFWDSIKNSSDPEDFKAYLKKYPNGEFAEIAGRRAQAGANAKPPTTSASEGEVEQAVAALKTLGSVRIDFGKFGEENTETYVMGQCRIKFEERALWNSKARFKPATIETTLSLADVNIASIGVTEVRPPDRPAVWVVTVRSIQGRTFTSLTTQYENRSLEKIKVPTKTDNPTYAGIAVFMDYDSANRYAKAFAAAARLCGAKSETF